MSILVIHLASVAALAGLVELACRLGRFRPAVCHALWLVVLAKLVVPPVVAWPADTGWVTRAYSAWEVEASRTGTHSGASVAKGAFVERAATVAVPPAPPPVPMDSAASAEGVWAPLGIVALWVVGGLVVVLRQLRKIQGARATAQQGNSPPEWLQEQLKCVSARLGVPAPPAVVVEGGGAVHVQLAGSPVLVVSSESLREVPVEHWNTILTHEVAHLKRRDHWVAWVLLVAGAIWWWNPLLWWVRRRVGLYSEMACDAWVVHTHPGARKQYAETMVHIMAMLSRQQVPVPAVGLSMWSSSTQERRLWMIMKSDGTCKMPGWAAAVVVVLALLSSPAWVAVGQPGSGPEAVVAGEGAVPVQEDGVAGGRAVPVLEDDTPPSWQLSLEPDDELRLKLDTRVNIEFEDIHMQDIVAFIMDSFDVNVVLDQRVVAPEAEAGSENGAATLAEGVVTDGMVPYVNLKDMSLRDSFRALLTPLNLTYELRGGLVWVTSAAQLEKDAALALPASRTVSESDDIVAKLNSVAHLEFESIHLWDVVEFVQDAFELNVVVDSRVVMLEGGEWDAPPVGSPGYATDGMISTVALNSTPLGEALYVFTRLLNLSYTVEPDFVYISTPALLKAGISVPAE